MQKKLFRIIFYKVAALFLLHFSTTTNLLGYKQIHSSSSASLMQILKKASPEKPSPIETVEVQDLSATMTSESTETEPEEKNKYEWTLMFYAQAKNNLSSFILNNFNEIAKTFKSDKIAIYVQWYQSNHEGIKRYRITQNKIDLVYSSDSFHHNHQADELVDFAEWCIKESSAKRYAMVLSNHGIGVIDPEWGHPVKMIQNPLSMMHNQRIQINDLVDTFHFDTFDNDNRGILFDEVRRVYMNNQELVKSFEGIKKLLGGKKLDLIGMDACYMQMVEVADLLSPFGEYFVASQDVELARGWEYTGIMKSLCKKPESTGKELAQYIVNSYDALYRGKTNLFTQSALHLGSVNLVKNRTHELADALLKLYKKNRYETKDLVRQARNRCQQFSMQTYIDLQSFCQELQKLIQPTKQEFKPLNSAINNAISAINQCVMANTSSTYFGRAHGMSIYFPLYRIDKSYLETPFARHSSWLELLCKSLLV